MASLPVQPRPVTKLKSNIDPSPFSLQRGQDAARERYRAVAEAAYFLAEQRGFTPGHEVEDWLAAERLCDERCE